MTKQITEPRADAASLIDWGQFLYRTSMQGKGAVALELTSMNNGGKPEVAAGSVFAINHAYFEVKSKESVPDASRTGQIYLYARASGQDCSFVFSDIEPQWSGAFGGWYNGGLDRAVAKMFCYGGSYNNKVILDSYNAMYEMNLKQEVPASGGVNLNISTPANEEVKRVLQPGVYRYEIQAGKGGAGGKTHAASADTPLAGAPGELRSGFFVLHEPQEILLSMGGDGEDGGNGDTPPSGWDYSGGGGGSTGGCSYLHVNGELIVAMGGSGGGGRGWSASNSVIGGGGGGGGGYGQGQTDNSSFQNGNGGKDGKGGVGGQGNYVGNGGPGGDGSGFLSSYGVNGSDGNIGSYGSAGGNSQPLGDEHTCLFFSKEVVSSYLGGVVRRFRNAFQGGGSGGGYHRSVEGGSQGVAIRGGSGGGGLKQASSGKAVIYRVG